jgi:glycosyltransferase involved in cell wall biosynthesis
MTQRVRIDGKYLALAGEPFRVRGVTYGSFVPGLDGRPFPERVRVKHDFAAMTEAGINTVRTYDLPPSDVLDLAEEHGLRVLAGVSYHDWRMEAHRGHAARRRVRDAGRRAVAEAIELAADRTSVLAVAVGNELPADIVRVHGLGAVEDGISELIDEIHCAHAELLATYANYPTTEFLQISNLDFACFNVFLEHPDDLRRYLRHLQVIIGNRPLVVSELGLASQLHGRTAQAESLRRQLSIVDEVGCAGATVFSWTDEWGVAGAAIEDWDFGITDRARRPKPALAVVSGWARARLVDRREWPRVTVVVCAYNEQRTIEECLESLLRTSYPDLEVLICDDGSVDHTLEIAKRFPFRVLELEHGGLSRARNAGLEAASGDIVAYLDADATCHSDWPFHLVLSMEGGPAVATGGPNLPFERVGFVERAVALSPGSPAEVLIASDRAEHVPGCNMAYKKHALEAIGGFDAAYTSAGDDVDVCWKLLERGEEIAFAPAAQVRHHRRSTVRGYLRQQRGYGRAERMLVGTHPHRFNRLGQARWKGFIYGGAAILPRLLRPVIYHGYHGSAAFQPVVRRRAEAASAWASALLPLAVPIAVAGALLATFWSWGLLVPAILVAAIIGYGVAIGAAVQPARREPTPIRMRVLVAGLHVAQPLARAWGRIRGSPLSADPVAHPAWAGNRWFWLKSLESDLRARRCMVRAGTPSTRWDLRVSVGPFVAAQVSTAVMWQWEPRHAVRYRVHRTLLAALVVGAAIVGVSRTWASAMPLFVVLVIAGVEWALLHTRVRRAVTHTTAGART